MKTNTLLGSALLAGLGLASLAHAHISVDQGPSRDLGRAASAQLPASADGRHERKRPQQRLGGTVPCVLPQLVFDMNPGNFVNVPAEGGPVRILKMYHDTAGCPTETVFDPPQGLFTADAKVSRMPNGRDEIFDWVVAPNPGPARVGRMTLRFRDLSESKTLEFRQAANPNLPPPHTNDVTVLGAERTCSGVKMNVVKSGANLKYDTYVLSPNRKFKIIYQKDGNFVLYKGTGEWVWDIQKPNVGGRMAMQTDGNLVSYPATGGALWSSKTQGNPGAFLAVQDDGNVVIYAAGSCKALWSRSRGVLK